MKEEIENILYEFSHWDDGFTQIPEHNFESIIDKILELINQEEK